MLSFRLVAILSVLFSLGGAMPGKHYLIETEDRPKAHLKQRNSGSKAKQVPTRYKVSRKMVILSNWPQILKNQKLKYWDAVFRKKP